MPYVTLADIMKDENFSDYIDTSTLDFIKANGKTRDRDCGPSSPQGCNPGNNHKTKLSIWPEAGADKVDPIDTGDKWYVVALIKNIGKKEDARLKIPGKAREVYWLMGPDSQSVFLRVRENGRVDQIGDVMRTTDCKHTEPKPLEADFRGCDDLTVVGQTITRDPDPDAEGWISCALGCCTARVSASLLSAPQGGGTP
jgi:hypothetical protein